MYGDRGNYFGNAEAKKHFRNSIWIELIGFDKDLPDYGTENYFATIGFIPDSISLHLTSVDFVNTYKGMGSEYILPPYACSYGGHACNDERKRQDWTNYDLKGLVAHLRSKGISVLASFFDMVEKDSEFTSAHPELLADGDLGSEQGILMIKRFADGTFYEDFFAERLTDVLKDYGFSGVQLADGISSPRLAIWYEDFSDDIIGQSGLNVPDNISDRKTYISENLKNEWLNFYRKRWDEFLKKLITDLKSKGFIVAVNSAWTRDPLEALYRYGVDYKTIEEAGADYFIVEDVSSDLAILADADNHNYHMSYDERKLVHYEFIANLMLIRALMGKIKITPLFMIWDNHEQWDVIHHAPTALQRAAAANFCRFAVKGGRMRTITDGFHFCLGDALTAHDWDLIRLSADNGYIGVGNECDASGAAFVWSESERENELKAFISEGTCHSAKWLALLMRSGATINKIIDIGELDSYKGDIVAANFTLMADEEKKKIQAYSGGRVIYTEYRTAEHTSAVMNPETSAWPSPLGMNIPPAAVVKKAAASINGSVPVSLISGGDECTVSAVTTGKNTAEIIIENNEYYYSIAEIHTDRTIKKIRIITKPEGYPLRYDPHSFSVRVPGRGVDIAKLEYE